jgi:hypothetical protein
MLGRGQVLRFTGAQRSHVFDWKVVAIWLPFGGIAKPRNHWHERKVGGGSTGFEPVYDPGQGTPAAYLPGCGCRGR